MTCAEQIDTNRSVQPQDYLKLENKNVGLGLLFMERVIGVFRGLNNQKSLCLFSMIGILTNKKTCQSNQ